MKPNGQTVREHGRPRVIVTSFTLADGDGEVMVYLTGEGTYLGEVYRNGQLQFCANASSLDVLRGLGIPRDP